MSNPYHGDGAPSFPRKTPKLRIVRERPQEWKVYRETPQWLEPAGIIVESSGGFVLWTAQDYRSDFEYHESGRLQTFTEALTALKAVIDADQ